MSRGVAVNPGVAVTAWSIHLPGRPAGTTLAGVAPDGTETAEEAHRLLGRKGLLGKEPATRLALCAVHRALGLPAGHRRDRAAPADARTAVVAAGNLGNLRTVVTTAAAVRAEGVAGASVLDAPNASSNIVASTVAIRYGLGGPNLMVCSGHPAGLDAVELGRRLIAAGRADRAVVVGVEPDDEVATAFLDGPAGAGPSAVAACVVLERSGPLVLSPVAGPPPPGPHLVLAAGRTAGQSAGVVDLEEVVGPASGALGVLQVAVAAELLSRRGGSADITCGDPDDGYRTTRLTTRPDPAPDPAPAFAKENR